MWLISTEAVSHLQKLTFIRSMDDVGMVCHVSSKAVSVKGVEFFTDLQQQSLRMQPLIL